MLQRAAELTEEEDVCDDPLVMSACVLDDESCPAQCREEEDNKADEKDDEVVKAGDLAVKAEGSNWNLFIGRASELDTLTFKTSEEVTISKIVLEREGYSTKADVVSVRLEDENGAKITEPKALDSKGQVKLTLKKDYKVVDGELNAIIVVETVGSMTPGATLGFKVVSVDSTAEDVDLPSKAYNYTAIKYDGSQISFTSRAASKDYNFVAGDMYEVAKFKVNTPDDSSIILRGFTMDNTNGTLDLRRYLDDAEVTIAGESVKGLEASVNKNDELVISFKDVEVEAKSKAEVIVKISLVEDFDTFSTSLVKLQLKDFVAVDGKVSSRVKLWTFPAAADLQSHNFAGSKVKLAYTKLGNVDAAQNSEDVLVAEGTITVSEAIKGSVVITADWEWAGAIKQLTMVVNGDEYDANPAGSAAPYTFTFSNVEIEKSGKVQFYIDTRDATTWDSKTINFSNFNFDSFTVESTNTLKYDESGKTIYEAEVSWALVFSKVTIQPAKASLNNKVTKDVEFINLMSDVKTIFEGTYTAKKGDIKLNEFLITSLSDVSSYMNENKVTFHVYVDDMKEEVADAKLVCTTSPIVCSAADSFDNVLVKAGKEATIRVDVEVESKNADANLPVDLGKYTVKVRGEDVNGNTLSWEGKATSAKVKVVAKWAATVSSRAANATILRKTSDAVIAQFEVKPANGASEVDLESISFKLTATGTPAIISADQLTLTVANETMDGTATSSVFTYDMQKTIKSEGATIIVKLNDEFDGTVELTSLRVNDKAQTQTFKKTYVEALAEIISQSNVESSRRFTVNVDKDSDVAIRNFKVFDKDDKELGGINKEFNDGDTFDITRVKDTPVTIEKVTYEYSNSTASTDSCINWDGNSKTNCEAESYDAHTKWKWDYTYTLVTTEPEDFTTNYGNYYKKVSEEYVQLTSSESWVAGSYYTRSATESCINWDGTTKEACEADGYDAHVKWTWRAAWDPVWIKIEVEKSVYEDYFKIGENAATLEVSAL